MRILVVEDEPTLASVIELVCDGEPKQDSINVRENRPRLGVGVG